jgi:site-specific DNA-methyltransferase (adenine-specific)
MNNKVIHGDAEQQLGRLPAGWADVVFTSPTYWGMRDYGVEGQIGPQNDPDEYVRMVADAFDAVRRALHDRGTAWLVVGDVYSNSGGVSRTADANGRDHYKIDPGGEGVPGGEASETSRRHGHGRDFGVPNKSKMFMPHRVAMELQRRGWLVRQDVVWHKPNHLPAHVEDRPKTKKEYVFLLSLREDYRWNYEASRVAASSGGRKAPGDVWEVPVGTNSRHDATFPPALVRKALEMSAPDGGTVLDPFCGSGTALEVAESMGLGWVGVDIKREHVESSRERLGVDG